MEFAPPQAGLENIEGPDGVGDLTVTLKQAQHGAAWCSMAQQRETNGSAPAVCCPCRWDCPVAGQGANRD